MHVVYEPGDTVDPAVLAQIEGEQTAIVSAHGTAHVSKNLVDRAPELLISMVRAAHESYARRCCDCGDLHYTGRLRCRYCAAADELT